eukprot:262438-Amphidinium_carterae.1
MSKDMLHHVRLIQSRRHEPFFWTLDAKQEAFNLLIVPGDTLVTGYPMHAAASSCARFPPKTVFAGKLHHLNNAYGGWSSM